MGLLGAVMATTVGNAVALSLIYLLSRYAGMKIHLGTLAVSGLPLSLFLGAWSSLVVLTVAGWLMLRSDSIFDRAEKEQL